MSRRSSSRLAIIGVVVLAALAGLVLWLRSGDGSRAAAVATAGSADVAPPTPTVRVPATPTVAPSLPRDPSGDPAVEAPREYAVGDRIVRDHRKGGQGPVDLPPSVHPPDGRKIQSSLTSELAQKVKAVMNTCAAAIPPEARGEKPRMEGQIVIAIKDQQVTITRATVQLRNVVGAAVDATKQCIEQQALGITHPTDEADVDSYDITLSFAL